MKLFRAAILLSLLILSLSTCGSAMASQSFQLNQTDAAQYLKNHFNQKIGLIYESEDTGVIAVGDYTYNHSQIYFIYSDNLLAEWALKPYDPQLSNTISQTISSYSIPNSNFYEVLFGTTIPAQMRAGVQLPIEQSASYVVLAEFHNSSTVLNTELNGDTLIYQSLNSYLNNDTASADYYFYQAYDMWDGKGIYDDATQNTSFYANYKLALLLYASKVLNLTISDYGAIENQLWSMQQANGGITSLADLAGNPIGSANTETTSIALLSYNEDLIHTMQSILPSPTSTPTPPPTPTLTHRVTPMSTPIRTPTITIIVTPSPTPTPTPTPTPDSSPSNPLTETSIPGGDGLVFQIIAVLVVIFLVGLSAGLLIRRKKVT